MSTIEIPNTLEVVIQSWETAEEGVRGDILRHAPGLDETEITSRFHEAFARKLDEASREGRIETAFLEDLRSASLYDEIDESEIRRISRGLLAQATLHPGETERQTGGDLGLVIVRPKLTRAYDSVEVTARHRRGLLGQAKLRPHGRRWGKLTPNQEKVLPGRISYLGLLLYRYLDRVSRELAPFSWQICCGHSLSEIKTWLSNGSFPRPNVSRDILLALGSDGIGTSDVRVLDTIIAPAKSRYLEVRIDWPDDGPPATSVRVLSKAQSQDEEKVRVQVQY